MKTVNNSKKKIGTANNIFTIYNPVESNSLTIKREHRNEFIYVGRTTFEGQHLKGKRTLKN